jgi:TPR repeat protein
MVAGDIPNARLLLQQAAEAGNATAALELGATYDPTMPARVGVVISEPPMKNADADITMARLWYEKARDLGSTEATVQLERLTGRDIKDLGSPGR